MQILIITIIVSVLWSVITKEKFENFIIRLIFGVLIIAGNYTYTKYLTSLFNDVKAQITQVTSSVSKININNPKKVGVDSLNGYIILGILILVVLVLIFKRKKGSVN